VADRLRPLWDFDDLDATEQRFRAQLKKESNDTGRAVVLTQLARVEGLRSAFDASERLLQEAEALAGQDAAAKVRIDLERGRKLRSSGDPAAALPLFEAAFEQARASGEYYFAGDAAHMCALAVSEDREAMEEWTQRGLELGELEPDAAYWAGPLLNNLGWAYFDAGEHQRALELFEQALEMRKRDPDNREAIAFAEEAVQTARDALG
jgi:tetratricopeptide (TPR) repeat protein